jgi:hypothetical protein
MQKPSPQTAAQAQPHLVPRQVDGGFWMLYHIHFEQLLHDFGWFRSRSEAEAKIAELQRVAKPARFVSQGQHPDALN